ncbi:MAG: hypothetical protein H7A49_07010 [Akkermansiaceae bacterium]|nr:hypothetical protein [Akkermansiaceae bacterium]
MSDSSASHAADDTAAPPELVARAEELVRKHPECFWFWHPDAHVKTWSDVHEVVRNLRRYGRKPAWVSAQQLQQCL